MTKHTESTSHANTPTNPVIIENKSSLGQTAWILGIVFWILWILVLAIVFFPLTIVMAGIAIWKKNYLLGVVSVILAIVIFATSPTLWAIVAIKNFYTTSDNNRTVENTTTTEIY